MKIVSNRNNFYASIITIMLIANPINTLRKSNITSNITSHISRLPGVQSITQPRKLRQREVILGTTIKGTLTSSIIWTDNSRPSETRATIILNEPLLYSNGDIALPKDSSLVVEVSNWDRSGFVTLNAIAVVYEDNRKEFIQHSLPEDTLIIRNEDNEPLGFKTEESNNNSIVKGIFDEAVQTGTNNLPLPGGLGSAVSRTIRRNSRRSRRSNRNAVYSVKEETTVSIYVNNFLSIQD